MIKNLDKPLAAWKSKEHHTGEILDCLTIIFRTRGCRHNRCRMCGYRFERYAAGMRRVELAALLRQQLASVLQQYPREDYAMVKIFTSGSFLDDDEVPPEARDAIAEAFRGKVVIAETRPEYVTADRAADLISLVDDGTHAMPLYVAIGLETTNDFIREKCIDKGFSYRDFLQATGEAHAAGAGVKTYLLMKPPFLTEGEAVEDMNRSIREAARHSEILSLNLCTVQSRTEVEYYWKRGAYRPPYLWSVLSVLLSADMHLLCDPLGGGQQRGPHNCGVCDREIVAGIRDYSLNGDRSLLAQLNAMDCGCKREWEFVLAEERPYAMPLTR